MKQKYRGLLGAVIMGLGLAALLTVIYLRNRPLLMIKFNEAVGPVAVGVPSFLLFVSTICLPLGLALVYRALGTRGQKAYLLALLLADIFFLGLSMTVFFLPLGQGLVSWFYTGGFILWTALQVPAGFFLTRDRPARSGEETD
ncbi:hypothetical protein ACLGL1_03025 [Peptococcus simiae]|uniref:hypothetical protein n=1 Tax=Peptococcus simiae TaxID=1643805 RepID=UPI0039814463